MSWDLGRRSVGRSVVLGRERVSLEMGTMIGVDEILWR